MLLMEGGVPLTLYDVHSKSCVETQVSKFLKRFQSSYDLVKESVLSLVVAFGYVS